LNSFTFNGKSSAEFGLYISNKDIYSMPARDVTFTSVQGRNGDVIIDNGAYKNIDISYTVGIKNIGANIKAIKAWLSQSGYLILTDTYNPEYYRLACFNSSLDVSELLLNVGQAVISFNCKPFLYSFAGKVKYQYTTDMTINNPEYFDSLPFMRVKSKSAGTCSFYLNNKEFTIENVTDYVDVDSELMCVYRGNVLKNNDIKFTEFPVMQPGDNTLAFGDNIQSIMVEGRWRTL
jgi:predicted phage tail component-like protein